MQSSYSLVKKNYVLDGEKKTITTDYEVPNIMEMSDDKLSGAEKERKAYLSSYESIGKNIIEDAKRERERIRIEALAQAQQMEKEAYDTGYEQGKNNGYEDGKKEAIESVLPQVKIEAENIKNEALRVLSHAHDDYNKYLDDKSNDIIELAFNIARKIMNRDVLKDDGVSSMIEEAFEQSKGESNFVIRCNKAHLDELKGRKDIWKKKYNISGEIFVMEDNKLEPGNAWIEKPSGKVQVGIDIGLEKLEEAIFG